MNALSPEQTERSRKNHSVILNGLSRIGQVHVAQAIGVSESAISKMKESDFFKFSQILASCDLKVVPSDYQCVDPEFMEAMVTISKRALNRASNQLVWDDD